MRSETKEMVLSKYMKDQAQKAESLYRKGVSEGSTMATEGAYEMGRADMYECVRIFLKMTFGEIREMFPKASIGEGGEWINVFSIYDAEEFAEAIRAYRQGKKNAFKVGDEVIDSNGLRAIITNADTHYHLLYVHNGKTWKAPKTANLLSTGKSYENVTPTEWREK